jgi:hypothetical protein
MNQPDGENPVPPKPKSFISSTPLWLMIVLSNCLSIFASVGLSLILFNQNFPNSQITKNEEMFAIQESNKKAKAENEAYVKNQIEYFSIELNKKLNVQNDLNKTTDFYLRNFLTKITRLEEKTIPLINLTAKSQPYEIGYGFLVIPISTEELTKENKVNLKIKVINSNNIKYDNILLNIKVGKQPEVLLSTQSSSSKQFDLLAGQAENLEATIQNVSAKTLETAQVTFKDPPMPISR